jgi:hypothetical protein
MSTTITRAQSSHVAHLLGHRLVEHRPRVTPAQGGQYRAPAEVLERQRERGIEGQRAQDDSDPAGDDPPAVRSGQLVDRAGEESQAGRCHDDRGDPLLRVRPGGNGDQPYSGDDEVGPERRSGGADRAHEQDQAVCKPRAAQPPHATTRERVAGEEPEDRGDELRHRGDGDHQQPHLVLLGLGDPSEL